MTGPALSYTDWLLAQFPVTADGDAAIAVSPDGLQYYVAFTNDYVNETVKVRKYDADGNLDPGFTEYEVPFSEGYGLGLKVACTNDTVCVVVPLYRATILAADGTYIDEPTGPAGSYAAKRATATASGYAIGFTRVTSPRTNVYFYDETASVLGTASFTPQLGEMATDVDGNVCFYVQSSTFPFPRTSYKYSPTGTFIASQANLGGQTDVVFGDGYVYYRDGLNDLRRVLLDGTGTVDPGFVVPLASPVIILGFIDGHLLVRGTDGKDANWINTATLEVNEAYADVAELPISSLDGPYVFVKIPGTDGHILIWGRLSFGGDYVLFAKMDAGGGPGPGSCFWADQAQTDENCDDVAIVFEVMAAGHVDGLFAGALPAGGYFSGPVVGQGEFRGAMALAGGALFPVDYGSGEPEIPPVVNGALFAGGSFTGFVVTPGPFEGALAPDGGFTEGTAFDGALGIGGGMVEFPPPTGFAILVEQDPVIYAFAGVAFDTVTESVGIEPAIFGTPFAVFRERVRGRGAVTSGFEGVVRLQSGVEFEDALAVIVMQLVEEGFDIAADPTDNYTAVAAVADALVLSGVATTMLEAVNLIVSSLAFRDLAEMLAKEQLSDGITFDAAAANVLTAMAALVDTILAADQGEASALLGVVVGESLAAGDTATGALEAHQAIREGIALTLRLSLDSGQYVAYVLNTESKGLTTYQNYPFNSFAKVGGENGAYYGMTHDGIRLLEGPDDDGTAINGRIRLAFTNMGTGREKRMLAAYLGYTSTGALRLKAIVQDPASGQKHAHYYRLNAQPAAAPTAARVQIGQGLKSVYWAFEIEAIGGAEFMLDVVEMLPLVVETRVPGEGGGKR